MSMHTLLAQVAPPSNTWFTLSPEWGWYIVVYFFLGGIAGGAAFLSGLLDLFGTRLDRRMTRIGYLIALVAVVIGALLLIVDLTRPERFWHMMWQSNAGGPMFKFYSPVSLGIWILLAFGLFVFLAAVGSLALAGVLPRGLTALGEGVLGKIVALGCVVFGSALAGYTGLILTSTNRPLWGDTIWLALLFLLSGIAAGGAAMTLFGWRAGHPGSMRWLEQMEGFSSLLELIVLAIIAFTIWGVVSVVWSGPWGLLLLFGVVFLGILVPLTFYVWPGALGPSTVPVAAVLVLLGSFLLRTLVLLSSEAV
ncbi:MAG: polysulfide reductase NrfD [Thermomicrobiales bacterium]|nr:polysulfide reductase NrfD [Thermomicrobiales bacterium]